LERYFNQAVNQCYGTLGQIGQSLSQGDQQKCSAVQISQIDTLIFLIAGGPLAAMGFVESSIKGVLDFKGEGTNTIKAISFVPVLASVLTMIGATTTRAYASVDCSQSDDPRCQKDVAFCIAAGSLLGIWIPVAAQAAPFVCQVLQ
jgi:hypothetical protein